MAEQTFTNAIQAILDSLFGPDADSIFGASQLLQYISLKTRSANRGSKARGSFANLYAIYVLVEDYLAHGYEQGSAYAQYEGAVFSDLLRRQRQLPFGSKLQNHALNHRMNEEFRRYFPTSEFIPIRRDVKTNRYWINENLLWVIVKGKRYNLARAVLAIIDAYVRTKLGAFQQFIRQCEELQQAQGGEQEKVSDFIHQLLAPNVDARVFEIVSYAILKYYYHDQVVYFGFDPAHVTPGHLRLFKTGRTNANDGGIDFVMQPLGRFFQVTETLDIKKYFLDIDKLAHYPITFVIKSDESVEKLRQRLEDGARKQFSSESTFKRYIDAIEEIINIPRLVTLLNEAVQQGHLADILAELIVQSKVEFNYELDSDPT